MRKFYGLAILTSAAISTSVIADSHNAVAVDVNDPVSLRINIMQNVGGAMGILAGMAKGEIPFDAALAKSAFANMNTAALGFIQQYPEGSNDNPRSSAAPAIWENSDGFSAAVDKFINDTSAAAKSDFSDEDGLKAVFGSVAGNCKACHQDFRVKQQ